MLCGGLEVHKAGPRERKFEPRRHSGVWTFRGEPIACEAEPDAKSGDRAVLIALHELSSRVSNFKTLQFDWQASSESREPPKL